MRAQPGPGRGSSVRPARVAGWLIAATVALLGILLPASPASAHATLVSTSPAAGAILDQAPREVTLTFSEPVGHSLGQVAVIDPDGKAVQRGRLQQRRGEEVTARLDDDLRQGTYLVSYRVISADGHPISGGYTFSIGTVSQQATEIPASGQAEVDPLVRALLSIGKYLGYVGVALLGGTVLMLVALWPRRLATAGPARLAWTGWGLLFGGTLVSFVLQTPYGTGGSLLDLAWDDLVATASTTVGKAQIIRLALLIAASTLLWRITKGKHMGTADWGLLGGFAATILFTWPFAGHAWASPGRLLSIPADAIHVGAMAIWLGGLVVLARYLLPAANPEELAVILPVWSRWASYAVVVIAFTGTVQGLLEVGPLSTALSTTYGKLLAGKIIGLIAILGVAAFARSWVRRRYPLQVAHAFAEETPAEAATPRRVEETPGDAQTRNEGRHAAALDPADVAADDPAGVRRLRARVMVELALAAVVLMLATALVQTTPGRAVAQPAPVDVPFSDTIDTDQLTLQVSVDPAKKGNNGIHLTAFTPDGKLQKVEEWKATTSLPSKNLSAVDIPLLRIDESHVVGNIQLPVSGDWQFKFTIRTSDVDQVTVNRKIRIR